VRSKIQERRDRKSQTSEDEFGNRLSPIPETDEEEFVLDEDFSPSRAPETDFDLDSDENTDDDGKDKGGIMNWIKANPIPTALIGAGVIGGTILTVHLVKKSKKAKGLSGTPKGKKKKKAGKKKFVPRSRGRTTAKKKTKSSVNKIELIK